LQSALLTIQTHSQRQIKNISLSKLLHVSTSRFYRQLVANTKEYKHQDISLGSAVSSVQTLTVSSVRTLTVSTVRTLTVSNVWTLTVSRVRTLTVSSVLTLTLKLYIMKLACTIISLCYRKMVVQANLYYHLPVLPLACTTLTSTTISLCYP